MCTFKKKFIDLIAKHIKPKLIVREIDSQLYDGLRSTKDDIYKSSLVVPLDPGNNILKFGKLTWKTLIKK